MDKYKVTGGNKLYGTVRIQAAKNAVLPMLAACLLSEEPVVLRGCPDLTDIRNLLALLSLAGVASEFGGDGDIVIDAGKAHNAYLPAALTEKLRASVLLLGPLLARFREAELAYPGGCAIGARPVDLHLAAFRQMGVSVQAEGDRICCRAGENPGGRVVLPYPSVGATENVILFSVLGRATTVLSGAAREPEITDLIAFLNALGGKIEGAGTSELVIHGVPKLHGGKFSPMPDRIEAGTFLAAAACLGGEVCLENARGENLSAFLDKLRENGCKVWTKDDRIILESYREKRSMGVVYTGPYPAFPTDLQPLVGVLAAVSEGTTVLYETVFERRFSHYRELKRLGADVEIGGNFVKVKGARLTSGTVTARDLRGGAALTIAGLVPKGYSEILGIEYIDRGYADFDKKLSLLGAAIERITERNNHA